MDEAEIREIEAGQREIDAARSKRRVVRYKTRGFWSEMSNLRRRVDELERKMELLDRLNRRFQSQVEWIESNFPKLRERRLQIEADGSFDYLIDHEAPRPVGRPPRSFFEGKV